jgi:hypothetical protein
MDLHVIHYNRPMQVYDLPMDLWIFMLCITIGLCKFMTSLWTYGSSCYTLQLAYASLWPPYGPMDLHVIHYNRPMQFMTSLWTYVSYITTNLCKFMTYLQTYLRLHNDQPVQVLWPTHRPTYAKFWPTSCGRLWPTLSINLPSVHTDQLVTSYMT